MAETAVSLAGQHALPKFLEAVKMLRCLQREVDDTKDELESFQDFINDADKLAESEQDGDRRDRIKRRVMRLREAAFQMEDAIDECEISCEENQPADDLGCAAVSCAVVDYFKTQFLHLQMAYKVQDVKSLVRAERDGFQTYFSLQQGPTSSGGSQNVPLDNLRMAALYIAEADIVGLEVPIDLLKDWLMKGQPLRTVISVVGMGGLGKTTLVKKVFDNADVIQHFDCHAWITVSQSYTVEGLLKKLLEKLCKETVNDAALDVHEMIVKLRNGLRYKRYVVVFDDVWNRTFWNDIEFALVDSKNGSRIIITTRDEEVAKFCERSSLIEVHRLKALSKENSLELLCKKAFGCSFDGCCPNEYEDVGLEIVTKCDFLPLAIVAIGGLLYIKYKSALEWKQFSHNLSLELHRDSQLNDVEKILSLSYDELSYNLRSCLLYFGMYPEDYKVKSSRLIRQWIAEGFVKPKEGKTLEEVAEQYLMELFNRSVVQASSFTIDGNIKSCFVHDMIHDVILRKINDTRFCQCLDGKYHGKYQALSSRILRRLTITSTSNYLIGSIESSHIRSIIFTKRTLSEPFINEIFASYIPLKVLDFDCVNLSSILPVLPENLGNLIHLKYLNFRYTWIKTIPKSIGKLQNLETLDISGTYVCELPMEVGKLRKLRHLLGYRIYGFQVGGMTSLPTLYELNIGNDETVGGEIGKLEQLRVLGLHKFRKQHGNTLCPSLNKMQFLHKLYIESFEVIDLQRMSPSSTLQKLSLCGRLENLPNWIPGFENLVKLTLKQSELTSDPLKLLKDMSNLLFLCIEAAYEGESLHFESGGFQKLKILRLEYMDHLKSITIDSGSLHSLEKLQLRELQELDVIRGIEHLEKLGVVDIWGVPDKIRDNIYAYGDQKPWIILE